LSYYPEIGGGYFLLARPVHWLQFKCFTKNKQFNINDTHSRPV